ncbi:MAG: hypothetical protein FWC23_00260 [Chitinispirillia bacterium]|nr:hypothetical protein [Chitinispirillia bacterium]MCL2267608.1 hypothetical protein [Chitinispirillia bacterium]
MKRAVIFLGVFVAAVSILLYCTEVKFDNPLDEKGTNFLYGDTTDRADKIAENADGQSGLFDVDKNHKWACDRTTFALKLVGNTSDSLYHDDISGFRRLMGLDGNWNANLEWPDGVNINIKPARLTRGGTDDVDYPPNGMPGTGQYIIVYRAEKMCPDGSLASEATAQRGLRVIQRINIPDQPPVVQLRGANPFELVKDKETYTDPGVNVRDADNATEIPLSKIDILDRNGNLVVAINPPAGASSMTPAQITQDMLNRITIPNNVARAPAYYIEYHVTSLLNDKTSSVRRTVNVIEETLPNLPIPVIVLNTYAHGGIISGRAINHQDTAITMGGSYREIGVFEVYYMQRQGDATVKVNIDKTLVVPSSPNINTTTTAQRNITYTLPVSQNYQATSTTRAVYVYGDANWCSVEGTYKPIITFSDGGGASLTITAGQPWNAAGSWTVTRNPGTADAPNEASHHWKYLLDLGGLNPENPAKGTYTLTYVALNECGSREIATRTVTVP